MESTDNYYLITYPSTAKLGLHLTSIRSCNALLALKPVYVQNRGKSQSVKFQPKPPNVTWGGKCLQGGLLTIVCLAIFLLKLHEINNMEFYRWQLSTHPQKGNSQDWHFPGSQLTNTGLGPGQALRRFHFSV